MCFKSTKARLSENKATLKENAITMDLLIEIADGHKPCIEHLNKIKELLEMTNPSSDKTIVKLDKQIYKMIGKLERKLRKVAPKGKQTKTFKLIKKIEIAIVERGCVSRLKAECDENDFVIKEGILTEYTGHDSDVVLPNKVRVVGEKAFYDNATIVSIVLNDDATTIMPKAFEGCKVLSRVVGGESLSMVGDDAFYNCGALEEVVLEEGLTTIGNYAFAKCPRLYAFKLPKSVVKIGEKAFFLDKNLTRKTRKKVKKINRKALG